MVADGAEKWGSQTGSIPSSCIYLSFPPAALYPVNQDAAVADPKTREFLLRVVQILLVSSQHHEDDSDDDDRPCQKKPFPQDFITKTNDRDEKVLDFHHPIELRKLLDLKLKEEPETLGQLLDDCRQTLKYQVKTGE